MPYNLLLFPLLGGYYFIVRCNGVKFYHQRVDNQRLLFNSAIAGIGLLALSFIVGLICRTVALDLYDALDSLFPISESKYSFETMFAFILGIALAEGSNRFINKERAIMRAIAWNDDELELLLKSALSDKILLLFTLKTGKIYIGWPTILPRPTRYTPITILPAFSGYRDATTKEVKFTTQYLDKYAEYIKQVKITSLDESGYRVVLPIGEITSVSTFDIDAYLKSNHNGKSENQINREEPL